MTDIVAAANAVSAALNARVFVYSGSIDRRGFAQLIQAMEVTDAQPLKENTILILTTHGGVADAAYQIARLVQNTSKKFILCIPTVCKSAGTLIALGAHELCMTPVSELGPLDVQLVQRDEIGQRRSGLVVRTAFEGLSDETYRLFERIMLNIKAGSQQTVTFEVASRIAATIATGVMAPVYAQINPDALGNDLRDLHVATAYGERLVKNGKNAELSAITRLVAGYPAHGFIIDSDEARELFKNVVEPSSEVSRLVSALGHIVYAEQMPHFVARLDLEPQEESDDGEASEGEGNEDAKPSPVAAGRKTARDGARARDQSADRGGRAGDKGGELGQAGA